jgi:hypothetical protein
MRGRAGAREGETEVLGMGGMMRIVLRFWFSSGVEAFKGCLMIALPSVFECVLYYDLMYTTANRQQPQQKQGLKLHMSSTAAQEPRKPCPGSIHA